jgi:hypothetical protein
MHSIDERKRNPHVNSAKSAGQPIIAGDQRHHAGAGAVVDLSRERDTLSPSEIDEQIRRFFERPP